VAVLELGDRELRRQVVVDVVVVVGIERVGVTSLQLVQVGIVGHGSGASRRSSAPERVGRSWHRVVTRT
jgi:hypothetical protein